jgi:DNA polymerase-3 subunit delta
VTTSQGRSGRGHGPGFSEVLADLKGRTFRPVYVLEGEDTHRAEAVVAHLRDAVLDPAARAFNYRVYNGDAADLAAVLQQATSYPMLSRQQVIWVRDVERCALGDGREEALERYLASPVPETVLILSATKLDGRRRWVKRAKQVGYHFDFAPPEGAALVEWVIKAGRKAGLPVDHELAEMLCELVGNDLRALAAEVEKLALLKEEQAGLSNPAALRGVIQHQRAVDPFEVVRALVPGDPAPALALWRRMAAEGHTAHELAPLIIWRVRQAALVASLIEEGRSDAEVQSLAGLTPWAFQQVRGVAAAWGGAGAVRALRACRRCDAALKGSPLRPELVLERTLLDVCGPRT